MRVLQIITVLFWTTVSAPAVFAGTFEDAVQAYLARDYAKAVQGFRNAHLQGDARANGYLGRMYLTGTFLEKNTSKGLSMMQASATADASGESAYWLAIAHISGWGNLEQDYETALPLLKTSVARSYPSAYWSLGRYYMSGRAGLPKDIDRAMGLYWQGEQLGDQTARHELANLLSSEKSEDGVEMNPAKAIELYKKYIEVERAAGRTDMLWVSESRIEMMQERLAKDAVRYVDRPAYPYKGKLPNCDRASAYWTNCYGMRAVAWDDGGSRYEGEWLNNEHHGQGALISADGWTYLGGFENGRRKGRADFTWPDGSRYVGGWDGIGMHGFGRQYNPSGQLIYEGEYRKGKRWSAAHQKAAKESEVQQLCEAAFRRKYEFTETDQYGNRTEQKFERMHYGYLLEGQQSAYRGYGGHPTLVYAMVMFKNGWIITGKPQGYCVIRKGTYLKSNDLIDVEIKVTR